MTDVLTAKRDLRHAPKIDEANQALLEQAIRMYEEIIAAEDASPESRLETAWADLRLAELLERWPRPPSKKEVSDRQTRIRSAIQAAVDRLEQLVAASPGEPSYRRELALAYRQRASLRMRSPLFGEPPPAPLGLDETKRAVEPPITLLENLVKAYPDVPLYQQDLGETYQRLSILLQRWPAEWEAAYRKSLALFESLAARPRPTVEARDRLAASLGSSGFHLVGAGRHNEAEPLLRRAIAIREALMAEVPNSLQAIRNWENDSRAPLFSDGVERQAGRGGAEDTGRNRPGAGLV